MYPSSNCFFYLYHILFPRFTVQGEQNDPYTPLKKGNLSGDWQGFWQSKFRKTEVWIYVVTFCVLFSSQKKKNPLNYLKHKTHTHRQKLAGSNSFYRDLNINFYLNIKGTQWHKEIMALTEGNLTRFSLMSQKSKPWSHLLPQRKTTISWLPTVLFTARILYWFALYCEVFLLFCPLDSSYNVAALDQAFQN